MTVINTNVKSLIARDALAVNNRQLSTAMERLATGKRINSAADDAAGLSISTRMDSQVRGLQMAVKNSNDAISVTQTAEGAMQEINNILQRMRELAVQSSNDSNSADDRAFLQAEVSQLSDEIDRIATTTQFNGINVLDGGFSNKSFQIGANAGQTMKISVGDMRSTALGVASSQIPTSVGNSTTTTTSEVVTVKAVGAAATPTVARLLFGSELTGAATATFKATDSVSGLTTTVTASLDVNDQYSKDDFLTLVNKNLRQSAQGTSLNGGSLHTGTAGATAISDINAAANLDKMKFAVKLDAGDPIQNIDIRQRLSSTLTSGTVAATNTQVATAMQAELRAAFGDANESLTVTFNSASDAFVIADSEGRAIEVSQGAGDGFLFGTDTANGGALAVDANIQNNITASWDGNAIVLVNAAGGDITVDDVSYTGASVTFDVAAGQEAQADPVFYSSANYNSIASASGDAAKFQGITEPTSLGLIFSNREGDPGGTAAAYKFKITNGDGKTYATFTTSGLDVHDSISDATIEAAVRTALGTGLAAFSADNSIDISEFDVSFSGGTLSIVNTSGRALAIESFSSDVGSMTVAPMNELAAAEKLASKNSLFSTTRIAVNSSFFGFKSTNTAAGDLKLTIDGRTIGGTAGIAIAMSTGYSTGAALATAIQGKIGSAAATSMIVNGTTVTATIDVTSISVDYDADTGELVISDTRGRAIGFGLAGNNPFSGTGTIFQQDFVQGTANDANIVKLSSSTIQGDVVESTKVTMTLNTSSAATFNFKVNGSALDTNPVTYEPSAAFEGSTLETKLDALMLTLNGVHPSDPFQYAVSGSQITIWQRDGGEVSISDFATSGVGDDALTMTISGAPGQGDTVVAYEIDKTASTAAATASGVLAERTEATLTLAADDVYSMVINDGVRDYSFASHVVDLSETSSVQNFANALEQALDGSGISVSMDLNGKLYLNRADGGEIGLKSFTSGSGTQATWAPKVGQGDGATLDGSGSLTTLVESTSTSSGGASVIGGGGAIAVAQISVGTQEGAAAALSVLDNALTYVNSERSKLGAIENRLTHTIDNLANVINNTQAARSRIVDADYAAETSELARTQIIQQAATAMLAQANQSSQSVLSLLQ